MGALFLWKSVNNANSSPNLVPRAPHLKRRHKMTDYSLLFDVAKVRQAELVRDAEIARRNRNMRRDRKQASITRKLRTYFASRS